MGLEARDGRFPAEKGRSGSALSAKSGRGECGAPYLTGPGSGWVYETEKSLSAGGGPSQKWPKSGRVEKFHPDIQRVAPSSNSLVLSDLEEVRPSGLEPETF